MKHHPFVQLSILLLPAVVSAQVDEPSIRLAPSGLSISGITAGGEVLVMGAARRYQEGTFYRWEMLESVPDGDLDGNVVRDLDRPLDPFSVWAAVDLQSGRFAKAAGIRPADRVLSLPTGKLVRSRSDQTWIELPGGDYRIVVIRPGVGAFEGKSLMISQGLGRAPGSRLDALALRPLGPSRIPWGAPSTGDLLVVVDLENARILIHRLTPVDFEILSEGEAP